jgi:cell division transport system permease protein
MMVRWLSAPRFDLPLGRDASGRFLPWLIAMMLYLAVLAGVALLLLGDMASGWDSSLAGVLTLEVPSETSKARMDTALALLRQTPGIASVRVLEPGEVARLLQPWLGDAVPAEALPLPQLIDLHVNPDAAIDFADLQHRLNSIVPDSRLDDHRAWLVQWRGLVHRVETVIIAGIALIIGLIVLSVVFAASAGLAVYHHIVELLHLLGADDGYIAHQFQSHALRLALIGGTIGAAAAALTVAAFAGAARALDLPEGVTNGLGDWRIWAVLVGAALAAGLVAMATARLTVLRHLARMP